VIQIRLLDLSGLEEEAYQKLYALASPRRRQQADRYRFPADARRCIAADGLLRYAARQALGTDRPEPEKTPEGKPFLPEYPDFHFNLSHSGRWVVIAWGDCPVGIDVEKLDYTPGRQQVMRRFFTPEEQEYLFSAGEAEKAERFFEIWTAKESYLKYLGTGLRRSLNSFSVVPDGTGLGVRFTGRWLGDSYLTVCTRQEDITFTQLTPGQLG
jgi:4'-phosphopantetheinyl transferase